MMIAPVLANLGPLEDLSFKPNPAEVRHSALFNANGLNVRVARGIAVVYLLLNPPGSDQHTHAHTPKQMNMKSNSHIASNP